MASAAACSPPAGTIDIATAYTFSKIRGTDGSTVGLTAASSATICVVSPPK